VLHSSFSFFLPARDLHANSRPFASGTLDYKESEFNSKENTFSDESRVNRAQIFADFLLAG